MEDSEDVFNEFEKTIKVYSDGNTIYFLDEVNVDSVFILEKRINDLLLNRTIGSVNIIIDSGGGTSCGVYDLIKGYPKWFEVNTFIRGSCCSAATLLFLAGKNRYVGPSSLFMIHSGYFFVQDNIKESAAVDLNESILKHNDVVLRSVYKKETKIPKKMLEDMVYREIWFTAEECIQYGIAKEIKTYTKF